MGRENPARPGSRKRPVNAQVVDIPITPPEALAGLRCEEANLYGIMAPGPDPKSPEPCGEQVVAIVWHGRPGERQYAMCYGCADHNVRNRSGRLLLVTNAQLRMKLAHNEYDGRADT